MTEIADKIFKTSDLKWTDGLHAAKKAAIEHLKNYFTSNLNNARNNDDWWVKKGYYVEEVYFEDYHLADAFEEKKAFVKWFLEKFPEYNIPYEHGKRKMKKKIAMEDGSYFWVRPYQIARERDLLFGLNGEEAVTINNWREKIRDAESKEEIESIQGLLDSEWTVDNFVRNVKIYVDLFCQSMHNVKYEMSEMMTYSSPKHKKTGWFKGAIELLERKVYDRDDSECWGTQKSLHNTHRQAKMYWSNLIARELLAGEIKKVLDKAEQKAQEKGISHDWKSFPTTERPEPVSNLSTPDKPPQQPDPNDSGYESDSLDSSAEEEGKKEIGEVKNKLEEFVKKSKSPEPNKNPQSKEKDSKVIHQLEKQLKELGGKDNGISSTVIDELKGQVESLKKQLEEVKKSLKSMLEEAKDYAQKLFNYFEKESVKQITFEEDGSAKVEYEGNKDSKTFSASEIDNTEELAVLKEQVQQSGQKTLSRQELGQIVGSASSSTSTEQRHWEKYKYYYFVGIGVGLLVIGGLSVYWWMKKDKEQIQRN